MVLLLRISRNCEMGSGQKELHANFNCGFFAQATLDTTSNCIFYSDIKHDFNWPVQDNGESGNSW